MTAETATSEEGETTPTDPTGRDVGDVVPRNGSDDGGTSPDAKSTRTTNRNVVIAVAVVAVVVIGLAVFAFVSNESSSAKKNPAAPAETTQRFLSAIQKNDLDGAFTELCQQFRAGSPTGVLTPGAIEPLANAGGLKSFTVGDATITKKDGKSTATSPYELVVGENVKRPGRAELVLEDSKWKICSFSV